MHFPIIQLTSEKLDLDEWIDDFTFIDDAFVQSHTDYVQEIDRKERKDWLTWLPGLLKGLADVDLENETITFKSKEEIEKTLESYYRETMEKIENDFYNTKMHISTKFYHLRCYGRKYKDSEMLIHFGGSTYTSMLFVEDCYHYAGQTWHIGGVVDAHA